MHTDETRIRKEAYEKFAKRTHRFSAQVRVPGSRFKVFGFCETKPKSTRLSLFIHARAETDGDWCDSSLHFYQTNPSARHASSKFQLQGSKLFQNCETKPNSDERDKLRNEPTTLTRSPLPSDSRRRVGARSLQPSARRDGNLRNEPKRSAREFKVPGLRFKVLNSLEGAGFEIASVEPRSTGNYETKPITPALSCPAD